MHRQRSFITAGAAATLAAIGVVRRYQHAARPARPRLDAVDKEVFPGEGTVDLYWVPLGAGGHSVRFNGIVYEGISAMIQRRPRHDIYHTALAIRMPSGLYTIAMTPVTNRPSWERGVVAEGSVGTRCAARPDLRLRTRTSEWAVDATLFVVSRGGASRRTGRAHRVSIRSAAPPLAMVLAAALATDAMARAAVPAGGAAAAPDHVLVNADVVTVDADFSRAEAIAIADGLVLAVGTNDAVLALSDDRTAVVDVGGRAVLPGFVDPHTHSVQNQTPDVVAMADEQRRLIEGGTTTVGTPAISQFNMAAYQELVDRGMLLQRTHLYLQYNNNCGELEPDRYWASLPFGRGADQLLAVAGVKIFADGGSCEAPAVSFEYLPTTPEFLRNAGWTGHGDLFTPAQKIGEVVATTDALGGMVVIHAIGDVAIEAALEGIDVGLAGSSNANGHRIDHSSFSSLLEPEQLAQYGDLGITPAVQLMPWANACAPETIANWQLTIPPEPYAVVEQLDALRAANPTMRISWHGDGPFVPGTPLQHMYSPVTRGAVDAETGAVCAPEGWANVAPISVDEAIKMTTIHAATAMQLDGAVGSIEVGKYADLVILAEDPFGPDPVVSLAQNGPVATLINGRAVFCAGDVFDCASFGPLPAPTAPDQSPSTPGADIEPTPSSLTSLPLRTALSGGPVTSVNASQELTPARAAFDGDDDSGWQSGGSVPQWIEFDLGRPTHVMSLTARADQDPPGFTRHAVLGGLDPVPTQELARLEGETAWGDWMTFEIDAVVQHLRIVTTASPSWVSWLEIELIVAEGPSGTP